MVGFVNALAILIFLAQLPHLIHVPWLVYPLVAAGIVVMVFLPRFTTAVPAPLVAILGVALIVAVASVTVPTVSDEGPLADSLPSLSGPMSPEPGDTADHCPYAVAMALVLIRTAGGWPAERISKPAPRLGQPKVHGGREALAPVLPQEVLVRRRTGTDRAATSRAWLRGAERARAEQGPGAGAARPCRTRRPRPPGSGRVAGWARRP